jgi:hypothetical protein
MNEIKYAVIGQDTSPLYLLFYPEYEGSTFLQNIDKTWHHIPEDSYLQDTYAGTVAL